MAYKLYLTVEMPETYYDKDEAMDAAVKLLQDTVEAFHAKLGVPGTFVFDQPVQPIQARVFKEQSITSGVDHEFIVDIHDGAI